MKRKKILFVCTGNTCRSPMAEALMRRAIKQNKIKFVDVASAGLRVRQGDDINPYALQVLTENGVELKKFAPRQLTDKIYGKAFAVITMTDEQKKNFPPDRKVYTMSELTGAEVPDPYGKGFEAYRATFALLDECVQKIAEILL